MSEDRSVKFKVVKYLYAITLAFGLIASIVLFVVGLYALNDNQDNVVMYEKFMKYYGIDELNFEPVFNESNLVYTFTDTNGNSNNKQNFFGTIMVFVGLVSILFELIGLIGAIRENLAITITILIIMVIGTVSGLCTIKSIDVCTAVTQLLFITLAAIYVVLLKKELNKRRMDLHSNDVEMNNSRSKVVNSGMINEKYIDMKEGPPPYNEVDHNKNAI